MKIKQSILAILLIAALTLIGCGGAVPTEITPPNTVLRVSATLSTTVVGTATSSPIPVKVTFGETIDPATFTIGDLQITNGSAGNLQTVTAGTEYSFDVTPSSSNTTVTILLAADLVNSSLSSILKNGSATLSVAYQSTSLTVGMSTSAYTTNVNPFNVVLIFSDSVSDFVSGDVTVGNGSVTGFSGTGTTYTLQITPAGQGNVTVDIPAGVATKSGGTTNQAATQLIVKYDSVKPVATLTSAASDPTPTSPIPVRVTFDEIISSFALSNLSITNGTASGLTQVTAGRVYDFSITPTANGTVTVQVLGGITDLAGNTSLASASISRLYDNTQPTVTITSTATNPTNLSLIPITITFSESVTGFTDSSITVTNGSKSSFAGSGTTYTLNIAPSSDGTVTVAVGAGVAQDSAGNNNQAATNFTLTSDRTVPTATLTTTAGSSTNISPIPVTLTFGEAVTGFTNLSSVSIGNGTASSYFKVSDSVYIFQVTPSSTSCNVTIDVAANAGTDAAGNKSTAATQLAVSYDSVQPTTTLSTSESTPSKNATFAVTVIFSKSVTGFIAGDITVTNGSATLTGSGTTYTATITPAADGDVTVKVNANQAVDSYGNNNQASNTITIRSDKTSPTVSITSGASNPTSTSPVPVTVSFSEAVTGFTASDLVVTNGTAVISSGVSGDSVYTVNITPTAAGSVTVDLAANMAQDLAGNLNTAASQYSVTYTSSTGSLSVTVTYSGSLGPVSSSKKIIVAVSQDNFTTFELLGEISVNGGTATRSNVIPGSYKLAVAFDADGSGIPNAGDPLEYYNNILSFDFPSCTNIVITAGGSQSISIDFNDTLLYPSGGGGNNFVFDIKTISIDGDFSDWDSITHQVDDPSGDTLGGYGNDDIQYVKVAKDSNNIYFLIKMYEDFSTSYSGTYDIRTTATGSTLTQYEHFHISTQYNGSAWNGNIWANPGNPGPGPDLLSQSTSYVAVGTGLFSSYMEIKIPLSVIGNPTKFTNIIAAVWNLNYGSGSDVEYSPAFGEQ